MPDETTNQAAKEELIVSFGTPAAEANATAVAATIQAIVTLIDAANREIKPDTRLSIKVRALAAGSLEIPIQIIAPAVMFFEANISTLADTFKLLKYYFD